MFQHLIILFYMKGVVIIIIGVILFFLVTIILGSRSHYSHDHPILNKVRENFGKLDQSFTEIPLRQGSSSYTENKESITLCLKNPEDGSYYDMNTIMYVSLHELAHSISTTIGHGDEFKKNFSALLQLAAQKGIYDPSIPIPETYCGIGPED